MASVALPQNGGSLQLGPKGVWAHDMAPCRTRTVFAAAHVAARRPPTGHERSTAIDWEATLEIRHRLWRLGFGVADAMDTAQRGAGLSWPATQELIRRSSAEARMVGGRIACGAGTDHADGAVDLDDVVHAYEEQLAVVEAAGAQVVMMASRELARIARHPDDYLYVYDAVLQQTARPVIVHWLGEMFDPMLAGYWGFSELDGATNAVIDLLALHQNRVDGIKLSLLDAEREVAFRRRLPPGMKLYTGDDFNYVQLIRGDDAGHSDALLGILDGIAPVAARALQLLDAGDVAGYEATLRPTVPLARHVFAAPTRHYKTGLVFLAWLNGRQAEFAMLAGREIDRSTAHLLTLLQLADAAGLLEDPDLAAARMTLLLRARGESN
ncbi:MAG TPA: dihydrodipicolinate synthase family protein [Acidothermaceae bacterium]|jgi:hypothetical protein